MGANGNKKNTQIFAQEVNKITNGEYELVGEYIYCNIETKIKHNVCGKIISVKPVNFCRKDKYIRCPYCSNASNKRKTTIQFIEEVNKVDDNFEVLGEYVDNKTKIEMRHKVCNRNFFIKPNHFLIRQRCPICSREQVAIKNTKTKDDFVDEMYNLVGNEYQLIGDFVNSRVKVKLLHNKCQKIWEVAPSVFLYGIRCPYCNVNYSKVEDVLLNYINDNFPQYTTKKYRRKDKINNKMYEIDIFIPELNIGFEYNGIYWHSTLKKSNDYHKKKQEFFKTLGIDVYFLWEFWGIDECKNIIKHILTKDSQIEKFPYLEYGTKYLYANKDLYPNNPPYIQGYKYIEKVQKKKIVRINDSHIFEIYNSGYYKYIKQ